MTTELPPFVQVTVNENPPANYHFWRIDADGNRWFKRDVPKVVRGIPEADEPAEAQSTAPAKPGFLKRIFGIPWGGQ